MKTPSKSPPPLLYLAAGAIMTLSITLGRCDHREMNTYVHAESGSVVQVVNGEPAPGPGGRCRFQDGWARRRAW